MHTPQPVPFTEPSPDELRDVTEAELQIAALLMCGISKDFAAHVRTPQQHERIKPWIRRVR